MNLRTSIEVDDRSKQRADWRQQIIIEIEIFIHQIGSKTDQETEQTQPYTTQITRKLKTDYQTKS